MSAAPSRALFLDGSAASHETLRAATAAMIDVVTATDDRGPFPPSSPDELRSAIAGWDPLPDDGAPLTTVLDDLGRDVLARGARVSDPWCAAHLHPPTLISAAAAELAIAATNQSMDSFDQAPAATYAEDHLVTRLTRLLGLPQTATGVLTSGGTASNLLGLLLARDHAAGGPNLAGLPDEAARWRILASSGAHVSIRQAAAVLGLGRDAVVAVAVDEAGRMDVHALDRTLDTLTRAGTTPIAIVGTAGTTDTGAVDPLDAIAGRARAHAMWFHVDAAVGSAFALSDRLTALLDGVEQADSITADLHKLWWQPIGASALLIRDAETMAGVREPADYLNRAEPGTALDLVDRSLDTSRRFDALKILVSLRTTGRRRLGAMVEHVVALAHRAGDVISAQDGLELLSEPQTVTVLFRCHPPGASDDELDALNVDVQRHLLATGRAVVGRTRHRGQVALKLTFVNPLTTHDDVAALVRLIADTAAERIATPSRRPHAWAPPTPSRGERTTA